MENTEATKDRLSSRKFILTLLLVVLTVINAQYDYFDESEVNTIENIIMIYVAVEGSIDFVQLLKTARKQIN